jgi:hypothetical protein
MRRRVENKIKCRIVILSRVWNEQLSNLIAREFLKLPTQNIVLSFLTDSMANLNDSRLNLVIHLRPTCF